MSAKYEFGKDISILIGGLRSVLLRNWVCNRGLYAITLLVASFGSLAQAASLEWEGRYRVEGTYIKNFTLDAHAGIENSFIVHHLILEPKIVVSDGLILKTRFDVANNNLKNNQLGQVFGTVSAGQPPAVFARTGDDYTVKATTLYANWINEFGSFVVGRIPFQFGLGMTFNDGSGPFDHWLSTKDIVAYKLALGNITITPAYGKVRESVFTNEDDINDYIIMAEYTNPETDLSMGVIYDNRIAPTDGGSPWVGNDIPVTYFNTLATGGNYAIGAGYNLYNLNL